MSHHLLVNTAFRNPTHRRPIWLMGQCSMFVKNFIEKTQKSYLQLLLDAETATQLSFKPYEKFKVDGISVFTDFTLPLLEMGFKLEFTNQRVKILNPVRNSTSASNIVIPEINQNFSYLLDTIKNLRQLSPEVPVIGVISGAFSLAAIMIESSANYYFPFTKAVMFSYPKGLRILLAKAEKLLKQLFQAQIEQGAELMLISDPYAGLLSSVDFHKFALPSIQNIISDVKHNNVPVIYHTDFSAGRFNHLAATGADVLTVDWRCSIQDVTSQTSNKFALQGNFDPCILLGNNDSISQAIKRLLNDFGSQYGLIGSLGGNIFPNADEASVQLFVRKFQELSWSYATK